MTDRKRTEQILADYNRTLEIEVAQRTIELSEINARLVVTVPGELYIFVQHPDGSVNFAQVLEPQP